MGYGGMEEGGVKEGGLQVGGVKEGGLQKGGVKEGGLKERGHRQLIVDHVQRLRFCVRVGRRVRCGGRVCDTRGGERKDEVALVFLRQ